jgi:DNA-directed RNA polymerase sigma subunit (sigma70/sigma32)
LCLDDTIPRTLEHDEYVKNLIDNIKEDLSKNPDIKFNNEDFKKDLEKRLNEYNEKKSHVFSLTILYLNNIY